MVRTLCFYCRGHGVLSLFGKLSYKPHSVTQKKSDIVCWVCNRASLAAQMVKNPPAMQETQVQSLGPEDPQENEMPTTFLQYSCLQNSTDRFSSWTLKGYSNVPEISWLVCGGPLHQHHVGTQKEQVLLTLGQIQQRNSTSWSCTEDQHYTGSQWALWWHLHLATPGSLLSSRPQRPQETRSSPELECARVEGVTHDQGSWASPINRNWLEARQEIQEGFTGAPAAAGGE